MNFHHPHQPVFTVCIYSLYYENIAQQIRVIHNSQALNWSIIHHSAIRRIISSALGQMSRLAPVHLSVPLCPDRSPFARTRSFPLRIRTAGTEGTLRSLCGRDSGCVSLSGASERGHSGPLVHCDSTAGTRSLSSSRFQLISSAGERSRVLQKKRRKRKNKC